MRLFASRSVWALCYDDRIVQSMIRPTNGTCGFSERDRTNNDQNIETNGSGATVEMKDKRLQALIDEIKFCIAFFTIIPILLFV